MKSVKKERLDKLVLEAGLAETRTKAQALIMAGLIKVDGKRALKGGENYPCESEIELIKPPHPYVGRGGLKLEKAINHFKIDVTGRTCLDAGASTGGFTHCMLLNGAKKVYAVDVGYGQLDLKLREDPRVVVIERCNVRYLDEKTIPRPVDLITVDVSFISLSLVIPALNNLLKTGGDLICLIKPQFEAERGEAKKGVIKSTTV
ncbi:MAG: TlyA family RNA methyltransferase, partial [Vulcanimicrobiota bacterium]